MKQPDHECGESSLRFEMLSSREAIAPAVDRILATVGPAGLTEEQTHNLAVASAEALSNAAVHGNGLRPDRPVSVCVGVTPGGQATVEVADLGDGFDVGRLSDPTAPGRLMEPGGRGVFLMRRLVDELQYNKAGTRVRLTVRARPSSP